jgi:hypothetical protein
VFIRTRLKALHLLTSGRCHLRCGGSTPNQVEVAWRQRTAFSLAAAYEVLRLAGHIGTGPKAANLITRNRPYRTASSSTKTGYARHAPTPPATGPNHQVRSAAAVPQRASVPKNYWAHVDLIPPHHKKNGPDNNARRTSRAAPVFYTPEAIAHQAAWPANGPGSAAARDLTTARPFPSSFDDLLANVGTFGHQPTGGMCKARCGTWNVSGLAVSKSKLTMISRVRAPHRTLGRLCAGRNQAQRWTRAGPPQRTGLAHTRAQPTEPPRRWCRHGN